MDQFSKAVATILIAVAACAGAPQHVGNGILDVQPTPPAFAGQLDFDLMPSTRGTACSKAHTGYAVTVGRGDVVSYWSDLPIASTAPVQVRGLAAAAVLDALEKLPNADTMIVTRVVTEAKGSDETCAYVYGRGIRLRKAGAPRTDKSNLNPDGPDDPDDDDDESGD